MTNPATPRAKPKAPGKPKAPAAGTAKDPATETASPPPPKPRQPFDGLHGAVMHAKITTSEVAVCVEGHTTPLHGKVAAMLNGVAVVEGPNLSHVVPLNRITSIGFRTRGVALHAASDPD